MPLRFDAASLMAPGGVVSGLDNMGSAVVQALSRRAERRYADERAALARGQQVDDRELAYARALAQREEAQKTQGWYRTAEAGTEDEDTGTEGEGPDPYAGATEAQREQLRMIRLGKVADRATRASRALAGPQTIVPPSQTRAMKESAVDEYGDPIPGKHITVDQDRSFPDRVAEAMATAGTLGKQKGRGADAAAALDYAQGGQAIVDAAQRATPFMPDNLGINAYVAAGKQALNQGTTLNPEAAEQAEAEEAAGLAVNPPATTLTQLRDALAAITPERKAKAEEILRRVAVIPDLEEREAAYQKVLAALRPAPTE